MQLRHLSNLLNAGKQPQRVTAIAWSPNGKRLAVVTTERVVHLFDEEGQRRDKFAAKAGDAKASKKTFIVRAMAFSPDSTRLAIAQSDDIVFVYKLGDTWEEKKSICNKFQQSSSVTCLSWPHARASELVFGLAEGKVKVGNVRNNKAPTLYTTESYVLACCASPDGNSILTGHLDGSIYRYTFDNNNVPAAKFAHHSVAPSILSWGEHIVAVGSDKRVIFYDSDGRVAQNFDYSRDPNEPSFEVGAFNPSGQSVVLGSYDKLRVYNYSTRRGTWEEAGAKVVPNLYTVTALTWNADGSRLVVGSTCGSTDVFDACLKRSIYKNTFEFTYVSMSQVIVKHRSTGTPILLKSNHGGEIQKINIFQDRYLVANTEDTLLMADLAAYKLSEIRWMGSGNEKFNFDQDKVCTIFNAGELTLVEYGKNEILGSCRTEHTNPHLHSIRVVELPGQAPVKRVAYLVDLQTIHVQDLLTGLNVTVIPHHSRVDWLEMSRHGDHLIFRDKRRNLHLVNVDTDRRATLLNFCSYVQWVPNSDVVVAQNRNNLCVWYSIEAPEQVSMFSIRGEVTGIIRAEGKTQVVVDEGVQVKHYKLDEGLIEFGAAVDDRDFMRAIAMLETLEESPESNAMWTTLSQLALQDKKLHIAERCFAALGDVAKARYLNRINTLAESKAAEAGVGPDDENYDRRFEDYAVRAELAILEKRFKDAEIIYLEQSLVVDAMSMYQGLQKYDEAVRVAETNGYADLETYKRSYYSWLIDTNQFETAAAVKEREGDYLNAINLYLKGGLPARGALLVHKYQLNLQADMLERIANALLQASMFTKAGDFFSMLGMAQRAYEAYRRGNDFRRCIELAKAAFPGQVVVLEEEWGDYLVTQKQMAAAVNHYIEAGRLIKALDAAIAARQYSKGVQILESVDPDTARPYYDRLGGHFEETANYESAERLYLKVGAAHRAVEMYVKANRWADAERLARLLPAEDIQKLYVHQAELCDQKGKLKEAEKLYIAANMPDLAIALYDKHERYDDVLRLVAAYHKEHLADSHSHIAQKLESQGKHKEAEKHFLECKNWQGAINMYCANDKWEDAYRVARTAGPPGMDNKVAFHWVRSETLASSAVAKLGLVKPATDHAVEVGDFDFAFRLARQHQKSLLPDLHYKHALAMEDTGKWEQAERSFLEAKMPQEAVKMYAHNKDWAAATRVARAHHPESMRDIQIAQARVAMTENGDYATAEQIFLRLEKPELAVKMYKEKGMWNDVLRVVKKYMPSKLAATQAEYDRWQNAKGSSDKDELLRNGIFLEEQGEFSRAVDAYLQLTPDSTPDVDWLEDVWVNRLLPLATKLTRDRAPEVVHEIARRLAGLQRPERAAEVYVRVEFYKEAIDVYASYGMWAQAKELVNTRAPNFRDYVTNLHERHLESTGKADDLAKGGNIRKALDVWASNGEWDKCLAAAAEQNHEVLNYYATQRVEGLVKEGNYAAAIDIYIKYGAAPVPNNFALYKRIIKEVLYSKSEDGIMQLRRVLFQLLEDLKSAGAPPQPLQEFQRLLMIVHLMCLRTFLKNQNKPELALIYAKVCVSLLRYGGDVPADKIFYQAGDACRAVGWDNMAFVILNRYVDLSDAIEEGDASMLENADFEGTDVPFDVVLPPEPFLNEAEREEVRNWILQKSVETTQAQELSTRTCDTCGAETYEASLVCSSCKTESPPCVVSGYPVSHNAMNQCRGCGMCANKADWNQYIMAQKTCPWCSSPQSLQFT